MVVSSLKPSRDGDDSALRVYEASGRAAAGVTIKLQAKVLAAHEANLMEDAGAEIKTDGDSVRFDLRPFEIKTIRLRLKSLKGGFAPNVRSVDAATAAIESKSPFTKARENSFSDPRDHPIDDPITSASQLSPTQRSGLRPAHWRHCRRETSSMSGASRSRPNDGLVGPSRAVGGAKLTVKDFLNRVNTRHPLALEEAIYEVVLDALREHDCVIVDDFQCDRGDERSVPLLPPYRPARSADDGPGRVTPAPRASI